MLGLTRSKYLKEAKARVDEIETERVAVTGLLRAARRLVRIGSFPFDPIELTARIRGVEPSLRIEYDGVRIVVTARRALTEAEFNRVCADMGFRLDRT